MKHRLIPLLLAVSFTLSPVGVFAQGVLPGFNPSILIPDAAFADTKTFVGPEGIQRFLESKGSVLANTSPDFLVKLSEPSDVALKTSLGDPNPNAGRLRTAAEIIWAASQASGLNPQVILVTLNKEQGLITSKHAPDRLQRALNHAMGFDCPDSSGCGNLFPGFYYQLMGNVDTEGNRYLGAAKSLMKSFNTPSGRGPTIAGAAAKVGDSIQIANTLGDYENIFANQIVTLGNRATAALYRYTPHVFNGNYNFWKFFKAWFRYPNGTLLTSTQDGSTYIIQNGSRQRVPNFVSNVRRIDLTKAVSASATELADYPAGPVYGPPDDTIVHIEGDGTGTLYVFQDGVRHPASGFVLTQRKLDLSASMTLTNAEAMLFTQGAQLTPTNGTVLKGRSHPDVYLVDGGNLKRYSAFTYAQHNVAKKLQVIPDDEVASYPKLGYVAPLNGTIVRGPSSNDAYMISEQRRLPLIPGVLATLGVKAKSIVTLTSNDELAAIPIGPPAPPREGTFFSYGGAYELFIYKGGAKHPISSFVAKQRGITPDYEFESSIASSWPEGIAIPPRDGTLLKSSAGTATYIVSGGQLHELASEVAKNLKLSTKKPLTMPEVDFSALAKGGFATPAENTYFATSKTGPYYVFMGGVKRLIVPFVMKQRGMTPDYIFPAVAAADWADGVPVAPREGTLLRAEGSDTIYVVESKLLRSISDVAFKRRGYKLSNVRVAPSIEVDALPKGTAVVK